MRSPKGVRDGEEWRESGRVEWIWIDGERLGRLEVGREETHFQGFEVMVDDRDGHGN
jgi:hypothetical protein